MVMGTDAGDEFHSGAGRHLPHTVIHRIASGVAWGDVGPMVRGCSPPRESGAMKLKLVLATASAMGVLMSAAWANDSNKSYITQNGNDNTANIEQSAGSGGNEVGLASKPILQQGDNNSFSERQFTGGGFANGNNRIIEAEQIGNSNAFSSEYSNNAGGNVIQDVLQNGNSNRISIGRNAAHNSTVGVVTQEGSSNFLTIGQSSGSGNVVALVQQLGNNNGASTVNVENWGTYIRQSGSNNRVAESTIDGDNNNPTIFNTTYGPVHKIVQTGSGNGSLHALAVTRGSNGNFIHITQLGNTNQFSIQQGANRSSQHNKATLTQDGNDNWGTGTQFGSENTISISQTGNANLVTVNQTGDGNSATANITGNSNGGGMMSGGAASVAASNGLTSGLIVQDGFSNTALYTVSGSDSNQFAFLQDGNLNSITGSVSGSGGNQAAVAQTGSSNTVSFTQIGSSNNLAVSQ